MVGRGSYEIVLDFVAVVYILESMRNLRGRGCFISET